MATTVDNIQYATSNAITITLNSLVSSAVNGRSSAAVNNATNLYVDALVYVQVAVGTGLANDKAIYVYFYGSEDGTNYNNSSIEVNVGSDLVTAIDSPTNLRGPAALSVVANSITVRGVFSVAAFFNGVMPRKWGVVIQNYCGAPLTGTPANHVVSYTGITYTNT